MITLQQIIDYLSECASDPVPNFIMTAEIRKAEPSSSEYKQAYNNVVKSKWYKELAGEQWDDGSWGRFHTMDSKAAVKQKYKTTEAALRRAHEIGLSKDDEIISKCIKKMERYVRGEETWTDNIEQHNDKGKSHMFCRPFMTAANINVFNPTNPIIKPFRDATVKALSEAYKSGGFDNDYWNQKDREYIVPNIVAPGTYYGALLLRGVDCMDDVLQRQFLDYYWNKKEGIYYISNVPPSRLLIIEDSYFDGWLRTLELLSGFSLFREYLEDTIKHLLWVAERILDRDVSFGGTGIRYSDNWRGDKRGFDTVLRITRLLIRVV